MRQGFLIFLLCLLCQAGYAKIYYLRINDGILSITTTGGQDMSEVIEISDAMITFHGEATLQFVTDDRSVCQNSTDNVLLCWLNYHFSTSSDAESFYSSFSEHGCQSLEENDFLLMAERGESTNVISEEYETGDLFSAAAEVKQSTLACAYSCGMTFNYRHQRVRHYEHVHAREHNKLQQKCGQGFMCPHCKSEIVVDSFGCLAQHIRFYHPGMTFLDFLH